jgi:hypothetical protein
MPITFKIDHNHKIIVGHATGSLTAADILAFQEQIWSRPDVAGFDEIADFSDVAETTRVTTEEILDLVKTAAANDARIAPSRLAIVAKEDLFFGLGRVYQAYRELAGNGHKQIGVFRTMAEAMAWLGG